MQHDQPLMPRPTPATETQVSLSDSSPESSSIQTLSPSSTPSSTFSITPSTMKSLPTLSLEPSEKDEEKLLEKDPENSQVTSSSITSSITNTPYSIFSVFTELKKNSAENQLIHNIMALLNTKPDIETFTIAAEKLTSMDAEKFTDLLSKTSKKILSDRQLTEGLKNFLDTYFKPNTSGLIDYVHTSSLSEDDSKQEFSEYKLNIHRNVIGISLLEKLLFPGYSLEYIQTFHCNGFTSEENQQLSDILVKIDPQLFTGPTTDRHAVIKLDKEIEPDHRKKSSCFCGF
jgi:hypothetical protein